MPELTVDLGAQQKPYVPAGNYVWEVAKVTVKTVKGDDTRRMATPSLRLIAPEDFAGARPQYHNLMIDDKDSRWALELFLNALGLPIPTDPEERKNYKLNTDEWVGRQCVGAVVVNEGYNNNNFTAFRPLGGNVALGPSVAV